MWTSPVTRKRFTLYFPEEKEEDIVIYCAIDRSEVTVDLGKKKKRAESSESRKLLENWTMAISVICRAFKLDWYIEKKKEKNTILYKNG